MSVPSAQGIEIMIPVRILLVASPGPYRAALLRYFTRSPHVAVAGLTDSADDTLQAVQRLGPEVVFMNFEVQQGHALETIRRIKAEPNPPRVLLLVPDVDAAYVRAAAEAGADGAIARHSLVERLSASLEEIFLGLP